MPKDWYYFDDHLTGETTTLTTGETATVISPNEWRIKGRCGYYTTQNIVDINNGKQVA